MEETKDEGDASDQDGQAADGAPQTMKQVDDHIQKLKVALMNLEDSADPGYFAPRTDEDASKVDEKRAALKVEMNRLELIKKSGSLDRSEQLDWALKQLAEDSKFKGSYKGYRKQLEQFRDYLKTRGGVAASSEVETSSTSSDQRIDQI